MFGLKQKGLSPIGILFVVCVFAFFVLLGLKLGPKYIDYNTIRSVFKDAAIEGERQKLKPGEIRRKIDNMLIINNVRDFNLAENAFIGVNQGVTVIEFEYEVREHMLYNIDVLLTFSYSYEF